MQDLSFRQWLEVISDPKSVAQHWQSNIPTNAYQNQIGINQFVLAMAEPDKNANLVHEVIKQRHVFDTRYEAGISNNLLSMSNPRLKDAVGVVAWPQEPIMGFFGRGSKIGKLIIQHPPVVFTEDDKLMLSSIVRHELRHAIDWLSGKYEEMPTSKLDINQYARHVMEARAYGEQLEYLLEQLDYDVDQVEALVTGSFFGMDSSLHGTVKAFLDLYRQKEANLSKMFGAGLLGLSSMMPGSASGVKDRPAITKSIDSRREAARLAVKIINLFRFKNFIRA